LRPLFQRSQERGQGDPISIHLENTLNTGGFRRLLLFAPYWLVNQTGLPLLFREVRLGINKGVGAGKSKTMGEPGPRSGAGGSAVGADDSVCVLALHTYIRTYIYRDNLNP